MSPRGSTRWGPGTTSRAGPLDPAGPLGSRGQRLPVHRRKPCSTSSTELAVKELRRRKGQADAAQRAASEAALAAAEALVGEGLTVRDAAWCSGCPTNEWLSSWGAVSDDRQCSTASTWRPGALLSTGPLLPLEAGRHHWLFLRRLVIGDCWRSLMFAECMFAAKAPVRPSGARGERRLCPVDVERSV